MFIRKMKLLSIFILVIAILGCDTVSGISRVAYFKPVPTSECVIEAAKSIEGLAEIEYRTESGGRPLTLHGIERADVIHRYRYVYKGIRNNFYFVESYNGNVEFRHGYGCLNCDPPQELIDTIYPFIINLERQLQLQCGINNVSSGAKEFCGGVKCPSV
jgi:hypothetical protein